MWPREIGGVYEEPSHWLYYSVAGLAIVIFTGVLVSIYLAIYQRIASDLRNLSPAQLWLMIIPTAGTIWVFYVIWQAANAISEEFKRRNIIEFETYPALGIGWAFAFFLATTQLTMLIEEPVITILLAITTLVLFVVFVIKLAGFKDKLDKDTLSDNHIVPPSPYQYYNPQYPQQEQPWPDYQEQQNPPANFPPAQNPEPYKPQDDYDRWRPK